MKQLIIVRHGLAGKRNAKEWPNDELRPLTSEGKRQFGRAARGFSYMIRPVGEVLTSPLLRATQTAQLLVKCAEFPKPIEIEELKPDCRTAFLIRRLRQCTADRVAVVGHEPLLTKLIARLLRGSAKADGFELEKGMIAILEFEREIGEGKGRLVAFVPPSWLEAIH